MTLISSSPSTSPNPATTPDSFAELAWSKLARRCCVHPDVAQRATVVEKADFVASLMEALDEFQEEETAT